MNGDNEPLSDTERSDTFRHEWLAEHGANEVYDKLLNSVIQFVDTAGGDQAMGRATVEVILHEIRKTNAVAVNAANWRDNKDIKKVLGFVGYDQDGTDTRSQALGDALTEMVTQMQALNEAMTTSDIHSAPWATTEEFANMALREADAKLPDRQVTPAGYTLQALVEAY